MRDGDERPLDEEPLPDRTDGRTDSRTDTGFTDSEPFVDDETRPDSLRDPFDEPEPMTERTTDPTELTSEPDLEREPVAETVTPAAPALNTGDAPATDTTDDAEVLFGTEDAEKFRLRWRELQADFVDDPKHAVEGADHLVDEVMRTLSEIFAEHKRDLEGQLREGGETEELRVALRRYRSFFEQLLNA
jgi:hypothetical protein